MGWGYSVTVDGYIIAGQQGYAQPTFTADRRWLHLEARYNYENLRTGSLWAGYNFVWGKEWHFAFTPMIGGVFGRTNGIAPGCEASIAWKLLGVSLSNEYLFDTTSKSGNSYYAWPQLSLQPLNWLQFGAVAERTKVNLAHPVLRGGGSSSASVTNATNSRLMSSILEAQAQQLCSKEWQASEPLEVTHTGHIAGASVRSHLSHTLVQISRLR